jgi:L-alanine-DL-glutamate epimerase-like enolase superfamily enzyme
MTRSPQCSRRACLESIAAGALATLVARPLAASQQAEADRLRTLRITRITGFRLISPRPKFVGKNARIGDHGPSTSEDILWLETDQGLDGLGIGHISPEAARKIVGLSLDQLFKPGVGSVGPLGRADHALFDLVGKALDQPAWALMGGQGTESVPIYDGSIYFNDLLPQFESRPIARLLEEVDLGLERGHRAFKLKIGRGHKWMPPGPGRKRDIEVVHAIRKHVGPEIPLLVDANNGYSTETIRAFLDATADSRLGWIEEPFPEAVDEDLALKAFLKECSPGTLLADGESAAETRDFDPFLEPRALDVLQPDIRAFGLTLQWTLARTLVNYPEIQLAPHNWGSALGHTMIATLARGVHGVMYAEQDTAQVDVIDTSAFTYKDGCLTPPNLPGCGWILRKDLFKKDFQKNAWSVS